jgi:imidazole glycerol phosphate synthase glutamine amidotransferase subunit
MSSRTGKVERTTKETKVLVSLDLDGHGVTDVSTGIGFYDHMLSSFGKHGLFDLTVQVEGDLHIDAHHTVEDTAIALGQAFAQAAGDKAGTRRFGDALIPMDETLVQAAVDLSGRPYLVHREPDGAPPTIGADYASTLTRHVFESFTYHAAIALHVIVHGGRDWHHNAEAQYKAVARALRAAVEIDPRVSGVQSTKGVLKALAKSVVVLDSGSGNLRSAQRALERVGASVTVTADITRAADAEGLVVPGVGAFATCMAGLCAVEGDRAVARRIAASRPVLGICVGMQVLFEDGVEHGVETRGLGVLPGRVERLRAPIVPHMGWNTVSPPADSVLFRGLADARFYFVHSYAVHATSGAVTRTTHGEPFVAAVESGVVSATQFHPEKSGDAGLSLLENWLETV